MNNKSLQPARIGVFKYSLLFAALFFFLIICFDLIFDRLGSEREWLLEGLVIIICASFLSWLFARIRGRRFTKSEFWRLIVFCLLWSVAIEVSTITFTVLTAEETSLNPFGIAYFFGDILVINFLCLLLGFGVLGRRLISKELQRQGDGVE